MHREYADSLMRLLYTKSDHAFSVVGLEGMFSTDYGLEQDVSIRIISHSCSGHPGRFHNSIVQVGYALFQEKAILI